MLFDLVCVAAIQVAILAHPRFIEPQLQAIVDVLEQGGQLGAEGLGVAQRDLDRLLRILGGVGLDTEAMPRVLRWDRSSKGSQLLQSDRSRAS